MGTIVCIICVCLFNNHQYKLNIKTRAILCWEMHSMCYRRFFIFQLIFGFSFPDCSSLHFQQLGNLISCQFHFGNFLHALHSHKQLYAHTHTHAHDMMAAIVFLSRRLNKFANLVEWQ